MSADKLASAIGAAAAEELTSALSRIRHCIDQLSDEQIWRRSQPPMNSVGNLILHLCGNVRQWIGAGLGGEPDFRNRPIEFSEPGPIPKAELLRRLEEVVADAKKVLQSQSALQMMEPRCIQAFEISGLQAIFNSIPHFRGHTQEIIHITRLQLGDAYRLA